MTYRGTTYLIGATAAKQAGLASQADLSDDAPVTEESRLIYLAALAYLAGSSGAYRFKVAAGLPVDTWKAQKEALRAMLTGIQNEPVQLRIGQEEIRMMISVDDAMVVPQPLGSAFDFLLDDSGGLEHDLELPVAVEGKRIWPATTVATWRWCVIDMGFNTMNTYALDDMEPIRRFSTSPKLGMAYAYQLIGKGLGGRSAIEVQELLRQGRLRGYEASYAELGRQITRVLRSWNSPHFAFYLITGGGAEPLFEHILPDEPARILSPGAQQANGRGYLKAGLQKWGATVNA